ncbi:MAG: phage tail protein [Sphingorhabdus sp.]
MATIVLTAVGNAIGGPIGGAIGAAIGQQVDRALFTGKSREGPRLKELDVQTSSYGSDIPAIFGTMRVAGTVIWATDLIEHRTRSGGKGRPSTVNYSYSVSIAIALSSRPVESIGRIWADGNLLRGTAGDLKVDTQFRWYSGHGDQMLDPLIASAEAAGQSPAYRGIAYAVFEDLQLADYGNRIPSLTFEIFERSAPVPVQDIIADASVGTISGASSETLTGYAMSGQDGRSAIAPLLAVMPILLRPKAGQLNLLDWQSSGASTSVMMPVTSEGAQTFDRPARGLEPAYSVPNSLAIRHYEPARDFQSGIQRSQRSGSGRTSRQIDLPAAVDAVAALRLADLQLLQAQRERDGWSGQVALGPDNLHAGDWITDQAGSRWRITELEHFRGTMKVTAQGSTPYDPVSPGAASPGRNISAPDLLAGETQIVLIDMPVLDGIEPGKPQIAAFCAGTAKGWRRAALSVQSGDALLDIGSSASPAVIGSALTALPPHNANLVDMSGALDIQLLHDGMDIPAGSGSPLANGAGLCWLEGEFLRYGSAVYLGNGHYRLTQLLRGCYGTEALISGHQAGDRFVLLQSDTGRLIENVNLVPGMQLSVEAMGLGDTHPVTASAIITGNAIRPLAPVHGEATQNADGSLNIGWVRRARIDAGWHDGVDQALVEDREQYAVTFSAGGQHVGSREVATNALALTPSEIAGFGLPSATPLVADIRQIGRFAQSNPLTVVIGG